MLGIAGFLAPEILATAGAIPATPEEAVWFRSGVIPPAGQYGAWGTAGTAARAHVRCYVRCAMLFAMKLPSPQLLWLCWYAAWPAHAAQAAPLTGSPTPTGRL